MHIPDGYLSARTAASAAGLAVVGLGFALRQVRLRLPPQRVPLLGLAAAFVFAAQMLNFPVAGGTSGHLLGAVLAAVLLGPSAAVVVLASVLIVQCFMFADGGILALGANVFNMGLVGSVAGYAVYRAVRARFTGGRAIVCAAAFAAWCSTVLAATSCAGQLALSGTAPWSVVFPAMAGVHMLIGLGEAAITACVLAAVARLRPELLAPTAGPARAVRYRELAGFGLLLALGLALFVAPFASGWPDGLEKVAAALGFESRAVAHPMLPAPVADYRWPGLASSGWATAWAGGVGTLVAFAFSWVLARVLVPRPTSAAATAVR